MSRVYLRGASERPFPQRLKPLSFVFLTARLKPCPDVNLRSTILIASDSLKLNVEVDDVEGIVLDEFAALFYVFAH